MLAQHVEGHDLTGQWMSYHLAELIKVAEDEARATPELRIRIVETILNVWTRRRAFPGLVPAQEFDTVFAALERLGDDSPWAFSRLRHLADTLPDPESTDMPLLATAVELERLSRESVLTLIAMALDAAQAANSEWIKAAADLQTELEDELSTVVRRVRRRVRGLQEAPAQDAIKPAAVGEPGLEPSMAAVSDGAQDSPMSDRDHARRLREMADILGKVADALASRSP